MMIQGDDTDCNKELERSMIQGDDTDRNKK